MFPRLFKVVVLVMMIAVMPYVAMISGTQLASGDDGYDNGEITEFA